MADKGTIIIIIVIIITIIAILIIIVLIIIIIRVGTASGVRGDRLRAHKCAHCICMCSSCQARTLSPLYAVPFIYIYI